MKAPQTTCRVRVIEGIAYTAIGAGVVTAAGLADVGARTAAALTGAPLVFLADFRRPVWALSTAQLDAFFDSADPATLAPAAMVVPELYLPMFRAHSWNVAQGGILRKAFTDYDSASRWCRMRAEIHRLARTAP